ncbi:fumarylacetoacetate hydrolase family protein [Variovorax sp. RA8]|uniref:fumarylacetoacetate hydrolase family protein n=1 Tax=Variovorax sp. (strain JCM 16519 / RA8) TaxID=662548 RepID=UPI001318CED3|nr:fumarylacetoacetate hydrolase family protein [Variovorax sp. RA8]VTU37553.1 Fumarylpyruvate hydrolase [Variovorax sp. RA8]
MSYVVTPPATVGLPIVGSSDLFPVRRVYCVGRNYAAHAREMGFDPDREPPFFFCKPNDDASVVPVPAGETVGIPYPGQTANYHYEAELVVLIGQGGRDIAVEEAAKHIYGYAVGLDMTRRDLQMRMREQGRPWEIGKAFDFSAPIGPVRRRADAGEIDSGAITLEVNGETRQKSDIRNLIWSVNEVIANLSTLFALQPGDLIFTGTPEGVGAVQRGQTMSVRIDGLDPISVRVD